MWICADKNKEKVAKKNIVNANSKGVELPEPLLSLLFSYII